MNEQWLTLAGRRLVPVVQGGMGIGISAHRLAGTVARHNAMGTIASIDLRHHHPDLLARVEGTRDKAAIEAVNLIALDREIRAAKAIADGHGLVAVNVMKAVSAHAALVRQACESGADAIVMGAGLPLDLPDMTADYPKVALVPILSEARGVAAVARAAPTAPPAPTAEPEPVATEAPPAPEKPEAVKDEPVPSPKAAATPVKELSNEITTGISAPPMGITNRIP